jgi:hypothetical protein
MVPQASYDPMAQFADPPRTSRPLPMFAGIGRTPVMHVELGARSVAGTGTTKAPRIPSLFTVTSHKLGTFVAHRQRGSPRPPTR